MVKSGYENTTGRNCSCTLCILGCCFFRLDAEDFAQITLDICVLVLHISEVRVMMIFPGVEAVFEGLLWLEPSILTQHSVSRESVIW